MEKKLFNKVACFTDIHFGQKNNSQLFNDDCMDFITWFIEEAKNRSCETCICLGDWHNSRNTINVSTLNYTMRCLKMLSESFEKVFILAGNHDLFYRERREIHSLPMGDLIHNVKIIDDIMVEDDVAIVPWLVNDEWSGISKIKTKYMFGHFELPGFKMNAMITMPDHKGINTRHFKNQDYVFSGHFHLRQYKDNVHYIGNPFGHNYSDSGDFNRGAMFLEWGGSPVYVNYEDGPKYMSINFSDLIESPESFLSDKLYLKTYMDLNMSYEDTVFIKEVITSNYDIREFKLIQNNKDEVSNILDTDIVFETVDQIVLRELDAISSINFDKQTLIDLYNSLH